MPAEDLEQELDLRVRAFGPLGSYRERLIEDNLALIAAGQMLGAYEGNRLVGTARYLDIRQWWHGLSDYSEFAYLADDGFLSYGFDGGPREIEVSYLAAGSAATAAALWGILGSHRCQRTLDTTR